MSLVMWTVVFNFDVVDFYSFKKKMIFAKEQ